MPDRNNSNTLGKFLINNSTTDLTPQTTFQFGFCPAGSSLDPQLNQEGSIGWIGFRAQAPIYEALNVPAFDVLTNHEHSNSPPDEKPPWLVRNVTTQPEPTPASSVICSATRAVGVHLFDIAHANIRHAITIEAAGDRLPERAIPGKSSASGTPR